MVSEPIQPTPFADVNVVLLDFLIQIEATLGSHFRAMYLYGSLALGDFDPRISDIDFLVVTDADISEHMLAGLRAMHERFNASGSPWADRVEAAYIPDAVLRYALPSQARYPQIEKGGTLIRDPLEPGWVFQRESLRTHAIVLAGPDPRTLVDPAEREDLRAAAETIACQWLDQARGDPEWLAWVRPRSHQSFVVLTLCRLLYSLETGAVSSKPAAARWAQDALDARWTPLIAHALAGRYEHHDADDNDLRETIAMVELTCRRSASARP